AYHRYNPDRILPKSGHPWQRWKHIYQPYWPRPLICFGILKGPAFRHWPNTRDAPYILDRIRRYPYWANENRCDPYRPLSDYSILWRTDSFFLANPYPILPHR